MVCRVHTLAMPVVQDLAEMYKAVDGAATVNLLAKLAVEKSYHAKLDDTRSSLAVSPLCPPSPFDVSPPPTMPCPPEPLASLWPPPASA